MVGTEEQLDAEDARVSVLWQLLLDLDAFPDLLTDEHGTLHSRACLLAIQDALQLTDADLSVADLEDRIDEGRWCRACLGRAERMALPGVPRADALVIDWIAEAPVPRAQQLGSTGRGRGGEPRPEPTRLRASQLLKHLLAEPGPSSRPELRTLATSLREAERHEWAAARFDPTYRSHTARWLAGRLPEDAAAHEHWTSRVVDAGFADPVTQELRAHVEHVRAHLDWVSAYDELTAPTCWVSGGPDSNILADVLDYARYTHGRWALRIPVVAFLGLPQMGLIARNGAYTGADVVTAWDLRARLDDPLDDVIDALAATHT